MNVFMIELPNETTVVVEESEGMTAALKKVGLRVEALKRPIDLSCVTKTIAEFLTAARKGIISAMDEINPDSVTLEVGVKFDAEVGAVIAKLTGEGHMKISVSWLKKE